MAQGKLFLPVLSFPSHPRKQFLRGPDPIPVPLQGRWALQCRVHPQPPPDPSTSLRVPQNNRLALLDMGRAANGHARATHHQQHSGTVLPGLMNDLGGARGKEDPSRITQSCVRLSPGPSVLAQQQWDQDPRPPAPGSKPLPWGASSTTHPSRWLWRKWSQCPAVSPGAWLGRKRKPLSAMIASCLARADPGQPPGLLAVDG